jgi:hypothetical protein
MEILNWEIKDRISKKDRPVWILRFITLKISFWLGDFWIRET